MKVTATGQDCTVLLGGAGRRIVQLEQCVLSILLSPIDLPYRYFLQHRGSASCDSISR